MVSSKAKPVHEVRLGEVKAALWKNDTESGIQFNVGHRFGLAPPRMTLVQ